MPMLAMPARLAAVTQVISSRMTEQQERTYIRSALRAIEGTFGRKPAGWHGPEYGESERTPAVLFREESLVTKLLRDFLTEHYTAIRLDDETEHKRVIALVTRIMPNMISRIAAAARSSTSPAPGAGSKPWRGRSWRPWTPSRGPK